MNFQILLCRNSSIGSRLLCVAMWSRWSHSAILDADAGVVYDSTLWHGGVREWPLTEFLQRYPHMELRDCPVPESRAGEARLWLAAQLGKRYDLTALVGFIFRRNWQEDDSWFCSEMSETFRSLFGRRPIFRVGLWRLTPHHQDIVAS